MGRRILADAINNRDMRRAALCYAAHGWPVVPAAYFDGEHYVCVQLDCQEQGPHPIWRLWQHRATTNRDMVTSWYRMFSFSVALPTGVAFDVLEIPEPLALQVQSTLSAAGLATPVAVWRERHCRLFWVRPGAADTPEARAADVLVHGKGHWVPAPPTSTPQGMVQWAVDPERLDWQLLDASQIYAALNGPFPVALVS